MDQALQHELDERTACARAKVDAKHAFANARAAELLVVLHAPVMGSSLEVRHTDV